MRTIVYQNMLTVMPDKGKRRIGYKWSGCGHGDRPIIKDKGGSFSWTGTTFTVVEGVVNFNTVALQLCC
jgi:hypothetical protein